MVDIVLLSSDVTKVWTENAQWFSLHAGRTTQWAWGWNRIKGNKWGSPIAQDASSFLLPGCHVVSSLLLHMLLPPWCSTEPQFPQQSQPATDWNLPNCEPKEIFFPNSFTQGIMSLTNEWITTQKNNICMHIIKGGIVVWFKYTAYQGYAYVK